MGDWLGLLYVAQAPWLYCYELGAWLYHPCDYVTERGAWALWPSNQWILYDLSQAEYTETWIGTLYTAHTPWVYSFRYEKWIFLGPENVNTSGAWTYWLR